MHERLCFPGWKLIPILLSVMLFGRGYKLTPPPPAWYFKVNKADQAMVNRRLTAHPFASLQEKISIGENADRIANHTYIYATSWGFLRSPNSTSAPRRARVGKSLRSRPVTTS